MVAAILEVVFSRRAGRFNGNNVRKRPKIGHLSNASNQTGIARENHYVFGRLPRFNNKKSTRQSFFNFQENLNEGNLDVEAPV
jgi:hypothetical protein